MFLIRILPIEGSTQGKCVFFEDMGECNNVRETNSNVLQNLIHFAYTQIRTQFLYRTGDQTTQFQYRTRGGAQIPLAFRNKLGTLGVVAITDPLNYQSVMGSVNSFLKSYVNSKVLIVHPEAFKAKLIQPRVLLVPIGQVI